MLGQYEKQTKKTYLNISKGRIVKRTPSGEEYYKNVEGGILSIYQRERKFSSGTALYWYIDLQDRDGELYSIGFSYGSNTFKSIILSLASAPDLHALGSVLIEPYLKDNLEKVVVYYEGVKLDWVVKSLPPLEEVSIGGKTRKDDTKRMKFISSIVEEIGNKIIK